MSIKSSVYFALLACVALGASAASTALADDGGGQSHTISWDEFKARCTDSKDKPLNEQGRPQHIRIQCTNIEREFVPTDPGVIQLDASRHVITTIISDKFDVAAMGRDFPFAGAGSKGGVGACLRFKEIERTIQIEKTLGCGEILGIKGEITDFCASALDLVKGSSPKLIETRETGNVRDTCGGLSEGDRK